MSVSQLPRYRMLLTGLLKYTDPKHVDYKALQVTGREKSERMNQIDLIMSLFLSVFSGLSISLSLSLSLSL